MTSRSGIRGKSEFAFQSISRDAFSQSFELSDWKFATTLSAVWVNFSVLDKVSNVSTFKAESENLTLHQSQKRRILSSNDSIKSKQKSWQSRKCFKTFCLSTYSRGPFGVVLLPPPPTLEPFFSPQASLYDQNKPNLNLLLFDLPFVWFNPKILLVVFAAISRSHRINRMLNCNQYVNIDMMPLSNIVASMMCTPRILSGLSSWWAKLLSCLYSGYAIRVSLHKFIPPTGWQIIFYVRYSANIISELFHMEHPPAHSFPPLALSATKHSTAIYSEREVLIINLSLIIIPLTAPHKLHILTGFWASPLRWRRKSVLLLVTLPYPRGKKKNVCELWACLHRSLSKATWMLNTETHTENEAWGERNRQSAPDQRISSNARSLGFPFRSLSTLRSPMFWGYFGAKARPIAISSLCNTSWPLKMRKRVHSTRD